MADLIARRPSAAVQPQPHIPEPPPLPPSKTSYFSRLVYGSRPASAQFSASRLDAGRPNPLVPRLGYVAIASLSHPMFALLCLMSPSIRVAGTPAALLCVSRTAACHD